MTKASAKPALCPQCGRGTLSRYAKPETFTYRGQSITLEQPGEWCDYCGEGILTGEDMQATETALSAFRQEVRAQQAHRYKEIRMSLGLTQKDLAAICGGGVNAFSRYERGEVEMPLAVRRLLEILDRHPELLDELKAA